MDHKIKISATPLGFYSRKLLRKILPALIAIALLFVLSDKARAQQMTASEDASFPMSVAHPQIQKSDRATDFITYTPDSTFSIQIPDYLVRVNDLDERALLQFRNAYSETYFMVIAESKMTSGYLNLQQLENHFETTLTQNGGQITRQSAMKIADCPSFQNEVRWTVDGTPLSYLVTFIDGPDCLYKIYCWTLTSQQEYLSDFRQSVQSFTTKPSGKF